MYGFNPFVRLRFVIAEQLVPPAVAYDSAFQIIANVRRDFRHGLFAVYTFEQSRIVFIQKLIRTVGRTRNYEIFERFSRHYIILDGLRRSNKKDIVQHSERILPYFVNLCTEVIVIHGIYNALSAEPVTAAAAAEILIQVVIHVLVIRNKDLVSQSFIPLGFDGIQPVVCFVQFIRNCKVHAGQLIPRVYIRIVKTFRTVECAVHFQLDGFHFRDFAVQRTVRRRIRTVSLCISGIMERVRYADVLRISAYRVSQLNAGYVIPAFAMSLTILVSRIKQTGGISYTELI